MELVCINIFALSVFFFCFPVTSKFKLLLHPPQNRTLSTRSGKYDGSHKQRKDNPARMKFSMRPTKSTHTHRGVSMVSFPNYYRFIYKGYEFK